MWWPIDGWKHIRNSEQQTDREACSKLFPNQGGHCCSGPNKILKHFRSSFYWIAAFCRAWKKCKRDLIYFASGRYLCLLLWFFSLKFWVPFTAISVQGEQVNGGSVTLAAWETLFPPPEHTATPTSKCQCERFISCVASFSHFHPVKGAVNFNLI